MKSTSKIIVKENYSKFTCAHVTIDCLRRDTVFIQLYIPARLIEVVKSTSQGRLNIFSSLSSQKQNPLSQKTDQSHGLQKALTDAKDVRHLSIAAACSRLTGKRWVVLYSLRAVHQLLLLAKIRVVFVSGLPRGGKGGLPGNWIAACLFSYTRSLFGTRTIWHISRNLCR